MLISVIIPTYNAEKTVAATIESALKQTLTDFELIIIDDCSTDSTFAICESFAAYDTRIRIIKNTINMGVAEARNKGVYEAKGQWVAFLDSDDLWLTDKLEKQMAFMHETGSVISYTASAFIDTKDRNYRYILQAEYKLTYDILLKRNLMSCSSVIVRKDIIQKVKFPSGSLHEDYATWLIIVKNAGAAYGLDEPLLVYRVSRNSRSGQLIRSGIMMYITYYTVGYNAAQALLMTLRYAIHSLNKRIRLPFRRLKQL